MDKVDKKILQLIQTNFPIVSKPFQQIAESVGVSEEEVLARIGEMQKKGIIRRLGGLFDSRKMGYTGILCAMRVPQTDIDRVSAIVNAYPGVTHNYLRNHDYNMWFTLLAESEKKLNEVLNEIKLKTGIDDILQLPAVNVFKVRVNFNLSGVPQRDVD